MPAGHTGRAGHTICCMRHSTAWVLGFFLSIAVSGAALGTISARPALGPATPCTELTKLTIPGVTIAGAEAVPAGPFSLQPGGRGGGASVPGFCRIKAVA